MAIEQRRYMSLRGEKKSDWKRVLELLYENEVTVKSTEGSNLEPLMKERISDEVSLSEREIIEALRYLKSVDLVYMREDRIDEEIIAPGGLTNEGLQLAHQIKTERQRRWTNILLTSGIIIVSVLTLFAQIM